MADHLYYILKLLRPRQWIKNFALYASIVFGGQLFNPILFHNVTLGFIAFCLLSSSTYIINDILDLKNDKLHPFKKSRPIALGKISISQAVLIFILAITTSLVLAGRINSFFLILEIIYLILQLSYSMIFKGVVIFDILFIATGYILRVLAGEAISGFHISVWLLLTTVSLSLFLAVGKRRSELTLLKNYSGLRASEIRKSLSHYSESLIDTFTVMFATSTFIFYALFTFLENPRGINIGLDVLLPEFLPYSLQKKWLMITIVPVVYGLMRYLQDIYEKQEGESPDRVLLSDKSLLVSVLVWVFLVIFVIYFIG